MNSYEKKEQNDLSLLGVFCKCLGVFFFPFGPAKVILRRDTRPRMRALCSSRVRARPILSNRYVRKRHHKKYFYTIHYNNKIEIDEHQEIRKLIVFSLIFFLLQNCFNDLCNTFCDNNLGNCFSNGLQNHNKKFHLKTGDKNLTFCSTVLLQCVCTFVEFFLSHTGKNCAFAFFIRIILYIPTSNSNLH